MNYVIIVTPLCEIDKPSTDIVMDCLCIRFKMLIKFVLSTQHDYRKDKIENSLCRQQLNFFVRDFKDQLLSEKYLINKLPKIQKSQ